MFESNKRPRIVENVLLVNPISIVKKSKVNSPKDIVLGDKRKYNVDDESSNQAEFPINDPKRKKKKKKGAENEQVCYWTN